MQFSETTDNTGLCEECDFILGTDSTDYPLKDKARNSNRWYARTVSLILQADNSWQWSDLNDSDLPIATTALVANQQDYSIADATYLKILKLECKDSAGNWIPLRQIDDTQRKTIAWGEYQKTAGTPYEFDLRANSIFLYPKPSYASSGGLKIYLQRTPDYFTDNDTTQEPGFAEPFHRIISYGMAYDYALAHDMTVKIGTLGAEIAKLEMAIMDFYFSRNKDFKMKISIRKENYSSDSDIR